jgi:hypothetical protein
VGIGGVSMGSLLPRASSFRVAVVAGYVKEVTGLDEDEEGDKWISKRVRVRVPLLH